MKKTRRGSLPLGALLLFLVFTATLEAGEPPPEPGWREVSCEACDYALEVPSFGHPLEVSLRPTGGQIQNYDETKLKVVSDGFLEFLDDQYYLEIRVREDPLPLDAVIEDTCWGPTRPLDRPEPSFRCEIDGVGGDSTHTDYAEVRVGGRAYQLMIDAQKLSRETVDRIFESLRIDGRPASR